MLNESGTVMSRAHFLDLARSRDSSTVIGWSQFPSQAELP